MDVAVQDADLLRVCQEDAGRFGSARERTAMRPRRRLQLASSGSVFVGCAFSTIIQIGTRRGYIPLIFFPEWHDESDTGGCFTPGENRNVEPNSRLAAWEP